MEQDPISNSPRTVPTGGLGGRQARAQRKPAEAVRQAMLDAALAMVTEAGGLTVSLDHLSYEDVIHRAGVSRTAAYRIWRYKEDFNVDLVCALAAPAWQRSSVFDEAAAQAAETVVRAGLDLLSDPVQRRRLLLETIRVAALANRDAMLASPEWRTFMAIGAMLISSAPSEVKDRVLERLRASELAFIDQMTAFYEELLPLFGLRLRPQLPSLHVLTVIISATQDGLGIAREVVPEFTDATVEIDGRPWTLPALSVLALVDCFLEDDPDYSRDTALAELVKRRRARGAGHDLPLSRVEPTGISTET